MWPHWWSELPKAGKHHGLERLRSRSPRRQVSVPSSAICNFAYPFSFVDKNHLYSMVSGAPFSPEVKLDLLHAEVAGKEAIEVFISVSFVNGSSEMQFSGQWRRSLTRQPSLLPHRERYVGHIPTITTIYRYCWIYKRDWGVKHCLHDFAGIQYFEQWCRFHAACQDSKLRPIQSHLRLNFCVCD